MQSFSQFVLSEAVSDNYIYHATDYKGASEIVSSGRLEPRTPQRLTKGGPFTYGTSFTRDYAFAFRWNLGEVIFVFDKTVLSRRTRIVPFAWGTAHADPADLLPIRGKQEMEEFAVGPVPLLPGLVSINAARHALFPQEAEDVEAFLIAAKAHGYGRYLNAWIPAMFRAKYGKLPA